MKHKPVSLAENDLTVSVESSDFESDNEQMTGFTITFLVTDQQKTPLLTASFVGNKDKDTIILTVTPKLELSQVLDNIKDPLKSALIDSFNQPHVLCDANMSHSGANLDLMVLPIVLAGINNRWVRELREAEYFLQITAINLSSINIFSLSDNERFQHEILQCLVPWYDKKE